jgi:hypothetical protein
MMMILILGKSRVRTNGQPGGQQNIGQQNSQSQGKGKCARMLMLGRLSQTSMIPWLILGGRRNCSFQLSQILGLDKLK